MRHIRQNHTKHSSSEHISCHDCLILVDEEGIIQSLNPSAARIFGSENEVLGKNLADVAIAEHCRSQARQTMHACLAGDIGEARRHPLRTEAMYANGTTFPAEFVFAPLASHSKDLFSVFVRRIRSSSKTLSNSFPRPRVYRQLVESSPQATLACQDGRVIFANHAASRLLGCAESRALTGRRIRELLHPDHHAFISLHIAPGNLGTPTPYFAEQVWRRLNGEYFNAEVGATYLTHRGSLVTQLVVRDITTRKRFDAWQCGQNRVLSMIAKGTMLSTILTEVARLAESQSRWGMCSILQLQSDAATLAQHIAPSLPQTFFNRLGAIKVGMNSGACGAASLLGEPVVVPDIASSTLWKDKCEVAFAHGLTACTSWPIFGKGRRLLGTLALYFANNFVPTQSELDLFGACAELAGLAIESRTAEEKMRYLAHYDGLTSLPNRFLFEEYLDLALRNARRRRKKFAVLFVDLDRFKEINDTLGHDAGDMALREIAGRLRSCLRHNDKIARMGGDEFYVLIEDLNEAQDATEVAQKLLEAAMRPIHIGDQLCQSSASIGVAIFPDDGTDDETLLGNADKAMYRAKEDGKNAFRFFSLANCRSNHASGPVCSTLREPVKHLQIA